MITHPLLPKSEQEKNNYDFLGLPVPAAAGVIVSLVLVLNVYDLKGWALILPPLMLLIAWLMVSDISYPSFKKLDWTTQAKWNTFIISVVMTAFVFLVKNVVLAVLFLGYVFYGIMRHISKKMKSFKSR